MADAWTYTDWDTYDPGSSTRLSRLRSHLSEVRASIGRGSYSVQGKTHSKLDLVAYHRELLAELKAELALSSTRRAGFTQGRMLP